MTMFAVHYTYDERFDEREAMRPAHRAFITGLADAGAALAFARYDDAGSPGALLIFQGGSADAIEQLLDDDPYAAAGLIVGREVRVWNATGPLLDA